MDKLVARRLSYAEIQEIERTRGRICRGCRTVYAPSDVPASFGADTRTRDGLTKLCLACIAHRDELSQTRIDRNRADYQADYRETRKELLLSASRAHVEEYLAHDPPEHAIPLRAMPGYPSLPDRPPAPPRTKQEDAALTTLYSKLRDAPMVTWEQIAGMSKRRIPDYFHLGPRALTLIDEHLRTLGLPILKP